MVGEMIKTVVLRKLELSFPWISHSVSVVPKQILLKLWPHIDFQYPSSIFKTPDGHNESRFHCITESMV
jgi:hypothetical protein